MHLRIAYNVASYHDLSRHQPHSQGFFPNAEQLMAYLLKSIALR